MVTNGGPALPSSSRSFIPHALILALVLRLLPVLLLPQTAFQPDEFYQSLEPAHRLVFGYGHLTWEWRDLPGTSSPVSGLGLEGWPALAQWYDRVVVGGRMRGWIWPGVFALVYKGLRVFGLDGRGLTVAPRLVGVLVAASTDYATYRLGMKVLGPGAGAAALFLSLTSLFNAHVLPRALSTSPETLLTTLALLYFPLPKPEVPDAVSVGRRGLVVSPSMRDVKTLSKAATSPPVPAGEAVKVESVADLDYAMMDRMGPVIVPYHQTADSLPLSAALATLAVCIRPTTAPLWVYLGAEHVLRRLRSHGAASAFSDVMKAIISATLVLSASTALDYSITDRLYFPILTFIHYNLLAGVSASFGATSPFYHLTQSLPIMLFPVWYWFAQGFLSALLPSSLLPARLAALDRPAPLRALARAITFAIAVLSLSPHSEWRFLHPFLPPLLLFALPPLFRAYTPSIIGMYRLSDSVRQYTRISKRPFYLILLAPLVPYIYLNAFHGSAQVEVINALRRGDVGDVTGLAVLMPCHSTPWISHLHKDIPAWFLTCEPPIGVSRENHTTPESLFYASPAAYLDKILPYPSLPLHGVIAADLHTGFPQPLNIGSVPPSHIVLFGLLLGVVAEQLGEGTVSVRTELEKRGYEEVWRAWNGFDWAQDEPKRRGGVRVWSCIK